MKKASAVFLFIACVSLALADQPVTLSVQVTGISGPVKKNVLANLTLMEQRKSTLLTEQYILTLFARAEKEIREAVQVFGYYNPRITSSLSKKKNAFAASFTVFPGPPVLISSIEFSITNDGAGESYFKKFSLPFKTGDIFNHQIYEDAKKELETIAEEYGYLDAAFTQKEVPVKADENTCVVRLHFDTGKRCYLGHTTIIQDILAPSFVQRYIFFKPGDPYQASTLLTLRRNLSGSDYFSNIDIQTQRENKEQYVLPVVITLEPLKKYKFFTGAGYGTDTGPRGTVGWENRRINRYGHQFRSIFSISRIQTDVTGLYEIPLKNPVTDTLTLQSGLKKEITDTSTSRTLNFIVKRRMGLGKGWSYTLFSEFSDDFYTVGETDSHTRLTVPGINVSRLLARNIIFPVRGSYLSVECKGTQPDMGSTVGFIKTSGKAKIIRTLLFEHRLLLRGEAGYIDAETFDQLPPSLRFFTGGDNSVRGYSYNTLGPRDENNDVIGGRYLLIGSAEYEYKITTQWRGAFFYDAGNALNDIRDDFKKAWGTGSRWRSPVGPIRIDAAFPIHDRTHSYRIHINMEPDL